MKIDRWVTQVVAVLADEFDWDDDTRAVIAASLTGRCADGVPAHLEVICDSPAAANARLKANRPAGRWGLRVADYRYGATDDSRFAHVNAQLAAISEPDSSLWSKLRPSRRTTSGAAS